MTKALVIDDELGESDSLSQNISDVLEQAGFEEVIFSTTWDDANSGSRARDKIEDLEIKVIFLDLIFKGQRRQGVEIFNEIKKLRSDIAVIILTVEELSYPEVVDNFIAKGAVDYIIKADFSNRKRRLLGYLSGLAGQELKLTLSWISELGRGFFEIEVNLPSDRVRSFSLSVGDKILNIIMKAITDESFMARFPLAYPNLNIVLGLYPWDRTVLHKEVHKFNSRKSGFPLLVPIGEYGKSAYRLNVGEIEVSGDGITGFIQEYINIVKVACSNIEAAGKVDELLFQCSDGIRWILEIGNWIKDKIQLDINPLLLNTKTLLNSPFLNSPSLFSGGDLPSISSAISETLSHWENSIPNLSCPNLILRT